MAAGCDRTHNFGGGFRVTGGSCDRYHWIRRYPDRRSVPTSAIRNDHLAGNPGIAGFQTLQHQRNKARAISNPGKPPRGYRRLYAHRTGQHLHEHVLQHHAVILVQLVEVRLQQLDRVPLHVKPAALRQFEEM